MFVRLRFTALVLALGCQAAPQKSDVGRPNIVFVLVDDMGYGDLGCTGGKDIPTPHVDRLAREGVRFTDFYSNAPVCTPTRAAFMTGRWQQRVGLEWALGYTAACERRVDGRWMPEPDMHALGLPTREVTVAQMLKRAGYATGAFGKWHLGYPPEYNPVRRGFDEYFGTLLGHADYYRHGYYDGTYALRDGEQAPKVEGYLTDLVSRRAVEFVRKHAGRPFFLYVPYQAVHAPYQPPGRPDPPVTRENMTDGDRRTYAAMLAKVDEGVGMLLGELDRLGLASNTLFVFSSDNGGAHYSDNSPLFNGKQTLWEGGIRVPCLMRWPARLPAGGVSRQMGITLDLTATFLAAAGATSDRLLDGVDLLDGRELQRTFFWRIDNAARKQKAVRHGRWKYVQDGGYVHLLFDLEEDVGERRNLAIHHPDVMRDLQRRLAAWEAEVDAEEKEIRVR